METGYYKSKETIVHYDDLKERVFKGEIIQVTNLEEEYGGTTITFWRFGHPEQAEIFFARTKITDIEKYFQKQ